MKNKTIIWVLSILLLAIATSGDLTDNNVLYSSADGTNLNYTTGGSPIGADGLINGSIDFDGSTDYIDTGYQPPSSNVEISYNVWVKSIATTINQEIITVSDTSADRIMLFWQDGSGNMGAYVLDGTNSCHALTSNTIDGDGDWHMLTLTTSEVTDETQFYVDGNISVNTTGCSINFGAFDTNIGVGARVSDIQNYDGNIDEISIYERVLTSSEVLDLYNSGVGDIDVPQTDLIYHDTMDEVYDFSNNTNHIEYNGGTSINTDGKLNSAFDFDGTNDYLEVTGDILEGTGGSVSLWFNADTVGASDYMFSHSEGANTRLYIWLDASKYITFGIGDDGSRTTDVIPTADTWYHTVLSWDGTRVYGYVNNVLKINETYSYSSFGNFFGIGSFYANGGTTSNYFDGTIDEVAVWDRALNSSEIASLYNSGDGYNPYATVIPPVVNMTFTANNVYDNSAINNFNITINGTTYTTTTGTITTAITDSSSDNWNYNFSATNYYDQTGTINASNSTTEDVDSYQAIVQMTATEIYSGDLVATPTFYASAQSGTTLYINSGTIPITFEKANYYNKTQNFTITALTNTSQIVTEVYNSLFDVSALDWYNNTAITSFNVSLLGFGNTKSYSITTSQELPIMNGDYNVTFTSNGVNSRTYYNQALVITNDTLQGILYNTIAPTFYLNIYNYLGTTLLSNVVTTNNVTASSVSNPWSTTAENKINETNPAITFGFNISDLSYDHRDYSNNHTYNRTTLSKNVNMSPNQLVLTFSESVNGHITFFNTTNEPNNAFFNETSLLIIAQELYDTSHLQIKFNSLNNNGTIYNGTQYYETIVDHDEHITDSITILPQSDWYFYFKVYDPSGSELKDVTIRARFVVPNNASTFADPDGFTLFGQRLTENNGGTFFFTDSQSQINFIISKTGFETQSLTFPIGDYNYDESNPYPVTLQYSNTEDTWNTQVSISPIVGTIDTDGNFVVDTDSTSRGYRRIVYSDDPYIVGNVFAPNRDLVQIKTDYRDELVTLSGDSYGVYQFILTNNTDFLYVNGSTLNVSIYLDGDLSKSIIFQYGELDETSLFSSGDLANIPKPVVLLGIILFAIACAIIFKSASAGYIGWVVGSGLAFAIQPIFGWIFIPTIIIIIASWYKGVTGD